MTILCKNKNSISLRALSGMSTFEDVFLLFTKFILANKLLAQREEFTSISPATQGYLLIRALVVAVASVVLITLSFCSKNVCVFEPFRLARLEGRGFRFFVHTSLYFSILQVFPCIFSLLGSISS